MIDDCSLNRYPYLSVVAAARNDNHGGRLLARMRHFVEVLLDQCERYELDAELVLIEWNPPAEAAPLARAIAWPDHESQRCDVRIVRVPERLHRRFRHADQLPLFQMIAKNVGLRRTRAPFVLATNVDVLWSEDLMQFFAERRLRCDAMYRVDRHDVEPMPPPDRSVPERLKWCHANRVRVNNRYESIDLHTGGRYPAAWKPTWRVRLLEMLQDTNLVPIVSRPPLHLNTCGDFTLMHRDIWEAVRGYPEFEMYSMHLDSLLCTQARVAGAREIALRDPKRCYHLEHATGSGFKPENTGALNNRLERAGVERLSIEEFHRLAIEMRRNGRPTIFNDKNWGLANEELDEIRPLKRETVVKTKGHAARAAQVA